MTDPVRQSIIDNLVDRFEAIETSTGYSTSYKLVEDWRMKTLVSGDLPAIIIQDQSEVVKQIIATRADMFLTVDIYVVVAASTAPEDLRKYIADIYKCVGDDRTCGGYCEDMLPVSNEIDLDLEDSVYGVIKTTWQVTYQTGAWDLTQNFS